MNKSFGKEKENPKAKLLNYLNFVNKRTPLKTTIWEFLKNFLIPFKTRKQIKVKKGKNLIKQKLDISYILRKFYEIDKLKMLLLNEKQYNLFEYLPKPVILKNSKISLTNNKNAKFINAESNEISKIKKMHISYQNILKQNDISDMDKKVIDIR